MLLKQTKETSDRSLALDIDKKYINLGSFSDIIHNHNKADTLAWQLAFELEKTIDIEPFGRLDAGSAMAVAAEVSYINNQPNIVTKQLIYQFSDKKITLKQKSIDSYEYELITEPDDIFRRNHGRAWALSAPVRSYAFPDQVRTYYYNASCLATLEKSYEDQIDKIYYLGPLREPPERGYLWTGTSPIDVGHRGENTLPAIIAATLREETRNDRPYGRIKPFQEIIAYWLKKLGLISNFYIEEIAKGSNH